MSILLGILSANPLGSKILNGLEATVFRRIYFPWTSVSLGSDFPQLLISVRWRNELVTFLIFIAAILAVLPVWVNFSANDL